ncbi:MAG: phosphoribosyltransferase-like protein, partial [Terriglobia bacterium]
QLLRALGPTNFSHFWEDNPLLDLAEKKKATAENCIALTCIAILGGRHEAVEELLEVQASLPLAADDQASGAELRRACERLLSRKVLVVLPRNEGFVVALQILREWLGENAVMKLVPIWTEYKAAERAAASAPANVERAEAPNDFSAFAIPEDDIIAVSQRLVFCGRQKDVADIRSWLRQFDDDARIEVAFLLLKRLAEKGFINEGTKSLTMQKLEEMVKARRLEVGKKAWKIERGRLDNLCLTYVDSELKSGATATRELRNMMRPGKSAAINEISTWMRSHIDNDPMVVIVDDFAGTGTTLAQGLKRFKDQIDRTTWQHYVDSGRISVFVMFAFPEAIDHVRKQCLGSQVVAATTLGDELRACVEESGIFQDEAELRFAQDVLLQVGRELYPDAPLGFGNLGALVVFHNAAPNNTLPIFWSNGRVGERLWKPLFPRA